MRKALLTASGVIGGILIIVGTLARLLEQQIATLLLFSGAGFISLFVFLLWHYHRYQERRIEQIIKSYKYSNNQDQKGKAPTEVPKSWGMNNSPFRERKSGLQWNGGNIKGLTAKRTKRRSFLK